VCGLINGVLMARFRLHPIVLTLATAAIFQGINYIITRGYPVVDLPESLLWLGKGKVGGLPAPVLVMLAIVVVMHVMLTRTVFGLRVLMIGGNAEASRLSGVNVDRVRIGIFVLSGMLAALGGIVTVGRIGNAVPIIGQDLLFPVVTATILGGTLLSGGVGSMAGTFMGAGIAGIVKNAMVILRFNIYLQDVAQGSLVLLALLIDQFRRGELSWSIITGKDH
jgi:ribose transport system permease protein